MTRTMVLVSQNNLLGLTANVVLFDRHDNVDTSAILDVMSPPVDWALVVHLCHAIVPIVERLRSYAETANGLDHAWEGGSIGPICFE